MLNETDTKSEEYHLFTVLREKLGREPYDNELGKRGWGRDYCDNCGDYEPVNLPGAPSRKCLRYNNSIKHF